MYLYYYSNTYTIQYTFTELKIKHYKLNTILLLKTFWERRFRTLGLCTALDLEPSLLKIHIVLNITWY